MVSWEAGLCGPQQPSGSSGSGWIQPMRTPVVVVGGGSERHICPSVWSLTLWPLWTTCVPVARGHGFSPSTQPVVFPAYGNCSLPLPLGPKCANPPPSTSPRCGIIPCGSLHLSMLYKFVPSLNSDRSKCSGNLLLGLLSDVRCLDLCLAHSRCSRTLS